MARGKRNNLIGKRFGHLTVLRMADEEPKGNGVWWVCECDCGATKTVLGTSLTKRKIKSCSQNCPAAVKERAERREEKIRETYIGKRFGKLTVVGFDGAYYRKSGVVAPMLNCVCDCGNHIQVRKESLDAGKTRSCGCLVRRDTDAVKYKSFDHDPSISEIVGTVLGLSSDNVCSKDKDDALKIMFKPFWQLSVRKEASCIRSAERRGGKSKIGLCPICGKEANLVLHHVVPVDQFGGNEEENRLYLCQTCHNNIHKLLNQANKYNERTNGSEVLNNATLQV